MNKKVRICKFCGKEFEPKSNRQVYCKGPHYRKCPVCGKLYLEDDVENLKREPVACSYECRAKKTRETSLEKYGVLAPGNTKEARKKSEETCLQKYGATSPLGSKEIQEKAKKTLVEKYGAENVASVLEIQEKRRKTCKERYGDKLPFNYKECYDKQHDTMLERYGVPYFCITDKCIQAQGRIVSNINKRFMEKLEHENITYEPEFKLGAYSYDIYLPELRTLIEIDPTYTHNVVGNHWTNQGIDKDYHLNKTEFAESNGYRCIHVFDWDNWNKIIMVLKNKKVVYARDCKIFKINSSTTDDFLNDNHLQNSCKGQTLSVGLIKNDELIEIMTFGKPRYSKKHSVELLRLCSKSGYSVLGGASKLFKYAVDTFQLSSIISYCDRSKFTGTVYGNIGMKMIRKSPPQEIWSRDTDKVTANLLRQRGYDQLFNANYGKNTSNEQLMLEHGWLPVYDCGQCVYEY